MNTLFWISFALLWLLVTIQGFALLEVIRQIGQIRKQPGSRSGVRIVPEAIKAGDPLPELTGIAADTSYPAHWEDYLGPSLSIVVLLSTHCQACRLLAEGITRFAATVKEDAAVVVIIDGDRREAEEFILRAKLPRHLVVIDEDRTTAKRFGVLWNPAAITIRQRKLGEAAIVSESDQLRTLVYAKEFDHTIIQKA